MRIDYKFLISILLLVLLESLPILGTNLRQFNEPNDQTANTNTSSDIPWRQIKFISPQQSLSQSEWHSGIPSFSAKGMDHLYLLTQYVIDLLQTPGLPFGVIKEDLFDDPIPVLKENKGRLLSHFWGLILTATIFLCIAVILPLIGLLYCCFCCNSDKHSRRAKHNHSYSSSTSGSPVRRRAKKKYKVDESCDPCCRSFLAVNLFLLILLMSFFVICAFVTNEYIRTGVQQLPKTVNQSTDDIMLFLNNTQYEINTLLRTNFNQLEQELGDSLDKSGLIVKNRLAVLSEAASLENLTDIVSKLDSILMDLRVLSGETSELRLLTLQLQKQLTRSKNDLEEFLQRCKDRVCIDLRIRYQKILGSFSVSTRIEDLPDLSPLMQNISRLLEANIVQEIKKGKEAFDEISYKIQSAVSKAIPDIKNQIKAVGVELIVAASDINEALRRPFIDLNKVKSNVNTNEKYIKEYEIYRWYLCLIGASIVFFVLFCYTFGLLSGACSQQPTRRNYKRRSKFSTRFFRCGIISLFLLFCPLLLGTIILFLIGGVSDKVLCYYLENPSQPQSKQIMSILQNKFEKLSYSESMNVIQGQKPNFADVLTRCHQNLSLYNVLQLNQYNQIQINSGRTINNVNISEILAFKDRYRIEEKLNAFLGRVNVNPSNVVLLTAEGSQLLENLKQTSLGTLNFSSYAHVIKDSITPLDLVSLSNELESEAMRLPKDNVENIAKLRNIAMDLKASINVVVKIKDTIETLTAGAEKIEKKANYGNKGLKEALTNLLKQAEDAQKFIALKGHSEIHSVAKHFVSDMSSLVDQYAEHVVEEIESGIGKCEPVSRAVNASVMALCKEIVLPFNGFWSSMASALILSVPSTLFAYILSRLYKKVKRFPARRESDSTLDNLDEDDIPLAHVDSKNTSVEGRGGPTPSAPLPGRDSRSDDDNWSPGALPQQLYGSRPPPYNFN